MEDSRFIKELKGMNKVVYNRLIKYPRDRDNDSRLEANIWAEELSEMDKDILKISAYEFLNMQIKGIISSSSTIRRSRRKVNEKISSTRGKSYGNRKQEGELVREQIGSV